MTLALYGKTRRRQLWLLAAALFAVFGATMFAVGDREQADAEPGDQFAVFTSIQNVTDDSECPVGGGGGVNCNQYEGKPQVYLNGGPSNDFLPDAFYCFSVYNPNTDLLLSNDEAGERSFEVSGGVVDYTGSHLQGIDSRGDDGQDEITLQFFPFDNTTNPGGVYKFTLYQYATDQSGSTEDECSQTGITTQKTDNFKVAGEGTTITVVKENDKPDPVLPETVVNYTITVTVFAGPLAGVDIVDDLPTGVGASVTAISLTNGVQGVYSGGDGGTVTWANVTLQTGDTVFTYSATVQADATAGDKINVAEAIPDELAICIGPVEDPLPCEDDSTITVEVPEPDPSVSIEKSNDAAGALEPGDPVSYTLDVTVVNGPIDDADIVDQLPAGIGGVTNISDGGTYQAGPNTVTWSDLDLADGLTSLTYDAVVALDATPGAKVNTATITHEACPEEGEPNCSDDSTVTVLVDPDITVFKDGPLFFTPGEVVVFTILVRNAGPGTAENVILTDLMPTAAPSWDVGIPAGATCEDDPPVDGGALLTCSLGAIEEDGERTITLTGTTPDTGECAPIVNTVNVTADNEADPDELTNEATHEIGCTLATGNLVIRKFIDFDGDGEADAGDELDDGWDVDVVCTDGTAVDDTFTTGDNGEGTILIFGLDEGTICTVTEDPASKAGHVSTGFSSTDVGGSDSGPGVEAVVTIDEIVDAEVDFFNQPQGTIIVNKTTLRNGANEPSQNGGWEINVEGCGIDDTQVTVQGNPNGSVTFSDLPACPGGYEVSENPNSKAGASPAWSPSGGTSRDVTLTAGETEVVSFTNVRNDATPTVTVTEPPPTNTPTNTPTPTPTNTPTNTPTATNTPTNTPTPIDTVAGVITPAPPKAGNGITGGSSSASLLMAVAGLIAMAGGFVVLAAHRQREDR
ncbi:MAG: DUF5979 domain-containing protein [Dehalococcoidia bacterium]